MQGVDVDAADGNLYVSGMTTGSYPLQQDPLSTGAIGVWRLALNNSIVWSTVHGPYCGSNGWTVNIHRPSQTVLVGNTGSCSSMDGATSANYGFVVAFRADNGTWRLTQGLVESPSISMTFEEGVLISGGLF